MLKKLSFLGLAILITLGLTTEVKAQSGTTAGDEFWWGYMSNATTAGGAAPTLRIQITSKFVTNGVITTPAGAFNQPFNVVPGVPTTVTFPAGAYENTTPEIPQNIGFKLVSNDYVSVSAESVEDASTDAARVLPRQSIKSDYLLTTYTNTAINTFIEFMVVATENGTVVEIIPTSATSTGRAAGVPFTVTLNEGQAYLVQSRADLTGTSVRSLDACKAIAVFEGSACTSVPNGQCCCDHLFEQSFPEFIWGYEYYTTGFRMQERIRILARENGTAITVNGGVPAIRNRGQFIELVPAVETPYHIVADKQIAVTEFAPSGAVTTGDIGDPFQARTFSLEQGVDTMSFSTIVGVNNNHRVEILLATADVPNTQIDGIPITGFVPHPQNPAYSIKSHVLGVSGVATAYELTSSGPMVVMVHGFGPDDSYAFGGGGQVNNLAITVDYVDTVCLGTAVNFNNEVNYVYNNHVYDFGDGNTSTADDPSHTYAAPGVYNASFAVQELTCLDYDSVHMQIYVEAPKDTAVISGIRKLCPNQSGFFSAFTTEPDADYNWNFGGGTVLSGTGAGPLEVSWPNFDTVIVTMSISNPNWVCPPTDPDTFMVIIEMLVNPDAGPDIASCASQGFLGASLTTLTGSGQWLNTTGVVVSNTSNPNSGYNITGGPGIYEMIWEESENGCSNTDTMYIDYALIAKPNAGPDATVCGYEYSGLAATSQQGGDGYWSSPDPGISFNPRNNVNSTASVLTGGVFTIIWSDTTANDCASPDTLMVSFLDSLKPDAGIDDSVCGTSAFLNAVAAPMGATGTWTSNNGAVFYSNPNDPGAQIFIPPFVQPQLDIEFYWTLDNGTCSEEDTVIITFFNLPQADAGANDSTCGFTITLDATGVAGGTGTWSATDGNGNAIPATFNPDNNTPNADVTVTGYGQFYMVWTIDFGVCVTSDSALMGFFQNPTPFAGPNDTVCQFNYQLNAATSLGTGVWQSNNPTATFVDSTSATTTVSVTGFGVNEFYWVETNGACQNEDTVEINFFEAAAITVVADSVAFCGSNGNVTVSLNKPNQNGVWSSNTGLTFGNVNDSSTTVSGSFGCHNAIYTIDYGACMVDDTIKVCLFDMPNTNAGADDTVCGTSTALAAVPSLGTGKWQAISSGVFVDSTSATTTVDLAGAPFGIYCFVWTETNGSCTNSDTVCIDFRDSPIAVAGPDQSICDSAFVLSATASVGTGTWTSQPAGVVFANANNANTSAYVPNGNYGSYLILWSEQNTICTDTDTLNLDYFQQPVAVAGIDDTICGTSYTLQGAISTVGSGLWTSSPAGVTFVDATDPNSDISITSSGYGSYQLIFTETNGTCSDADTVMITFMRQPIANAGTSTSVCALTTTLNATASPSATGTWSSPQGGVVFSNPNAANSNVTVGSYGVYDLIWSEVNGPCTDQDQIQISFEEQPNINVFIPDTICGYEFMLNLRHSVPNSVFTISNLSAGLSSNQVNDSTFRLYLDLNNPNYTCHNFDLTEDNLSCSDLESVTLCYYESPNPDAGLDDGICGFSYGLQGSTPIGNGIWSGPNGAIFSNPTSSTSNVDVSALGYGTYNFVWEDQNSICTDWDTVRITFLDNPAISCNCDVDTVYTTSPTFYFSDNTANAATWFWDFGDGFTSNLQNPEHDYITYGVQQVTLTVTDPFGCTSIHRCTIQIIDDIRFYVPNAFTPDGDNVNDNFAPSIVGMLPGSFEMVIFDRWGKSVFSTTDLLDRWDGNVAGTDTKASEDVYAVHINYKTFNSEKHTYRGMVVLVR